MTVSFPAALPAPRVAPSRDAPPLRWGAMGTGWIAERFVRALQRSTRQEVLAVGSREPARATAFAAAAGLRRSYGAYEDLVGDVDVDVVYVATPHPAHLPCALLALRAGKHVLVEKPLALDAAEGQRIADEAAVRGLFCMEALWTLFLPRYDVVRQLLADGVLGEVRTVLAEYGEAFPPEHRILRPDLAGGPLLDLGTYPVMLATWVLGPPTSVTAAAQPHPAGVPGQIAAVLTHPGGDQAVVHTTVWSGTPSAATLAGTAATLHLPGPAYQPGDVVLTSADGSRTLSWTEPKIAHEALHFSAAHVARCLAEGRTESPVRPLADSLVTLAALDGVRRAAGLT